MLDREKDFNYLSIDNGAKVINFSDQKPGCEARHILSDELKKIWLTTKEVPQQITIDIKFLKTKPPNGLYHFFGIQLWHAYQSNPKEIELYFSADNKNFILVGIFELELRPGIQIFQIENRHYDLSKDINYIKINVTKTFGGSRTYINQIFLANTLSGIDAQTINAQIENTDAEIINTRDKNDEDDSEVVNEAKENEEDTKRDESEQKFSNEKGKKVMLSNLEDFNMSELDKKIESNTTKNNNINTKKKNYVERIPISNKNSARTPANRYTGFNRYQKKNNSSTNGNTINNEKKSKNSSFRSSRGANNSKKNMKSHSETGANDKNLSGISRNTIDENKTEVPPEEEKTKDNKRKMIKKIFYSKDNLEKLQNRLKLNQNSLVNNYMTNTNKANKIANIINSNTNNNSNSFKSNGKHLLSPNMDYDTTGKIKNFSELKGCISPIMSGERKVNYNSRIYEKPENYENDELQNELNFKLEEMQQNLKSLASNEYVNMNSGDDGFAEKDNFSINYYNNNNNNQLMSYDNNNSKKRESEDFSNVFYNSKPAFNNMQYGFYNNNTYNVNNNNNSIPFYRNNYNTTKNKTNINFNEPDNESINNNNTIPKTNKGKRILNNNNNYFSLSANNTNQINNPSNHEINSKINSIEKKVRGLQKDVEGLKEAMNKLSDLILESNGYNNFGETNREDEAMNGENLDMNYDNDNYNGNNNIENYDNSNENNEELNNNMYYDNNSNSELIDKTTQREEINSNIIEEPHNNDIRMAQKVADKADDNYIGDSPEKNVYNHYIEPSINKFNDKMNKSIKAMKKEICIMDSNYKNVTNKKANDSTITNKKDNNNGGHEPTYSEAFSDLSYKLYQKLCLKEKLLNEKAAKLKEQIIRLSTDSK